MIDKIDNYRLIRTFSSIDFSVTPFKIDQNKNRLSPESGK